MDLGVFWEEIYEYMNMNEVLMMEGVFYILLYLVGSFNILRINNVVWCVFFLYSFYVWILLLFFKSYLGYLEIMVRSGVYWFKRVLEVIYFLMKGDRYFR